MPERDLTGWHGVPAPQLVVLEGRYARLEPLAPAHAPDLLAAVHDRPALFDFMPDSPPADLGAMAAWVDAAVARSDLLTWAVVDRATGRAGGRQALMRIEPDHGSVELGSILWGRAVARTRLATEAFALHAGYVFDTLGYRRLEWKCDDRNGPSKRAAERFGFRYEGRFAQHLVVKGGNRDTAWFAILDHEWLALRDRMDRWLGPANFDAEGHQRVALRDA